LNEQDFSDYFSVSFAVKMSDDKEEIAA